MFEHLIEFTHTMQDLIGIYHRHDASMNAKLDAIIAELKKLNEQYAHRN